MSRQVARSIKSLQVKNNLVVLQSKQREANRKEAGISGQADEGWVYGDQAPRMDGRAPIDTMGQPIPADVRVEEGVALDLGEGVNEPQAQRRSRREREQDGKHCAETEGGHSPK